MTTAVLKPDRGAQATTPLRSRPDCMPCCGLGQAPQAPHCDDSRDDLATSHTARPFRLARTLFSQSMSRSDEH